jgi:hypothetical protein
MSVVARSPDCDRNPASAGLDLMPDLPVVLRHESRSLSYVGLVDNGATIGVLPYALGVQLGRDWNSGKAGIALGGTFAHLDARGLVVEATLAKLPPVRLALAWAESDQVPFLLGQFNFFQVFDVCFLRARKFFAVGQPGAMEFL